jgi:SAM-dependent methyltransferase
VPSSADYFEPAYFRWQAQRAHASARVVVPVLIELFAPSSVLDVGCGTGAWLQVFDEHGVGDVVGVDGGYIDARDLRIDPDRFVAADLGALPELGRRFDLAISLEAAHYAAAASAAGVVAALCAAPVVYFSAAVPGQPGGPAQNRQWPGYWSDLFAERGYRCVDLLRPRLWEDTSVDWWYAQNGLLFLAPELPQPEGTGRPLPLVHPLLLAEVTTRPTPDEAQSVRARVRRAVGRGR